MMTTSPASSTAEAAREGLSTRLGDHHADRIGERILDAAFDQFCLVGFRRSSVDDVARRARVGRVTIYRRFASKHKLVGALLWRETRAVIATVEAAVRSAPTVQERFVEGFVAGMRVVRGHPLLAAALATEPETALMMMTIGASGGLSLARTFIAREVTRARRDLGIDTQEHDALLVAELLTRLTHSLVLSPESALPLDDDDRARAFARRYVVPMVLGCRVDGHATTGR